MLISGHNSMKVIVLQKGERIMETLKSLAVEKSLRGFFIGIGAVRDPEIGYYDSGRREYLRMKLRGNYEVVGLIGNIVDGPSGPIVHAHISLGGKNGEVLGGHLFEAKTSVTLEIILIPLAGLRRTLDEQTGLLLISEG